MPEVLLYHHFADSSLTGYQADSAALVLERTLRFLERVD